MLAGRGLREETVINPRSKSKETSVKAAKDQSHFIKGRGIDTMDIAGPKEERERLDAKKEKRTKNCEIRKESAAASAFTALSSSKSAQKKYISIRNAPLNLLSKREETEEEEVVDMGGGGSEIE